MKYFDLIEKYLAKNMSDEEKKKFENQMQTNSELMKEFELHKDFDSFLNIKHERDAMQIQVKQIINNRRKSRSIFVKRNYSIAASIVVLLSVSLFTYMFLPEKNERLYSKFYESYEFSSIERSTNEILDHTDKALLLYTDKKYNDFITYIEEQNLYNENDFVLNLLYGVSLLEIEDAKKAIPVFENLLREENMYSETINWYTALAYLKVNDIPNAKSKLNELILENGYYKDKALELMEFIK